MLIYMRFPFHIFGFINDVLFCTLPEMSHNYGNFKHPTAALPQFTGLAEVIVDKGRKRPSIRLQSVMTKCHM